jgi:hypothetical protein
MSSMDALAGREACALRGGPREVFHAIGLALRDLALLARPSTVLAM